MKSYLTGTFFALVLSIPLVLVGCSDDNDGMSAMPDNTVLNKVNLSHHADELMLADKGWEIKEVTKEGEEFKKASEYKGAVLVFRTDRKVLMNNEDYSSEGSFKVLPDQLITISGFSPLEENENNILNSLRDAAQEPNGLGGDEEGWRISFSPDSSYMKLSNFNSGFSVNAKAVE
ncbi:hypothetical protein FUAX_16880 [Fulvitalea axinellae]|uniref:Uncharacterized protein n=1 Tax=Fulvitalea axinellae TaxID=1182444 RepID=A0AAU9CK04_9BACT|nr:hypothetical protein FUAX_16880 [Fulvitalea axinellae]